MIRIHQITRSPMPMNHSSSPKPATRFGFTSTELVVASSLLVAVMAVIGPLTVRNARMLQDARHQQIALEELSSEMERLTALQGNARMQAIDDLNPSPWLSRALPNAEIKGETVEDEDGKRLVLTLEWKDPNYPRAPLRLVGWLDPLQQEAAP